MVSITLPDNVTINQVLGWSQISVLKTSPLAKTDFIVYSNPSFSVKKAVKSVQLHWNGKKIIKMQNVQQSQTKKVVVHKAPAFVPGQLIPAYVPPQKKRESAQRAQKKLKRREPNG